MVRTASVSIAGGALPLCASGVVVLPLGCRQPAPGQCTTVRKGWEMPLACHHNSACTRTGFGPGLQVFVVRHGFLLIIRGFVKVAVCNAGVIQQ